MNEDKLNRQDDDIDTSYNQIGRWLVLCIFITLSLTVLMIFARLSQDVTSFNSFITMIVITSAFILFGYFQLNKIIKND